jgi:hypothetical protein
VGELGAYRFGTFLMSAGVTCPVCKQPCKERRDGLLSEHKTPFYVLGQQRGGRRRERCPYSGGTWKDAKDRITPLRRRQLDREAADAQSH